MATAEYWDYTEEARNIYPEHRPLNVRIRQESYAWSTEGANEFVGLDYRIINDGFEMLRRVYLGFFVDSDVGPRNSDAYYQDDGGAFYTSDTTFADPTITYSCLDPGMEEIHFCGDQKLHLDICYMYDVPDDGESAKGGDVPGYFGGMFLGHTTDPTGERAPASVKVHTARFFNGSNAYPAGDPVNDTERYDLLQSGARPTRPTGQADDYRYIFSAGPFTELAPREVLQLQVAFVIGDGKDGMLSNAIRAQQVYNGAWKNVDKDALGKTGVDGRETCLRALDTGEPVTWKDPCDSLNPTTVTVKERRCLPDNFVDNDCNCCTPLYRNLTEAAGEGLETLVHWVGSVAPPPPATNVGDPTASIRADGDRSVRIAWDNQSELTADPGRRKILFTGYEIWRVQGWERPVGSAGPAPTDWEKIADLSLNPADSLGIDSPYHLRRYRQDIDSLYKVITGAEDADSVRWYYPVGRYEYLDSLGLKNGMLYFYDVTAYSSWYDSTAGDIVVLAGRPAAMEAEGVIPRWNARPAGDLGGVYVVPNPYIRGQNPFGWDLTPSNADPTGTKIAFVGLPDQRCSVKIYTLAGDLVQTLDSQADVTGGHDGAVFWNMISRNGQDVVSGVYLYLVECGGKSKVGRFVVVR